MIKKNDNGQYTWRYEISLIKNPSVFLLVWKILLISFAAIFLFIGLIDLKENGVESLIPNLRIFLIIFGVITAITVIGYLIYAAIMGGKYIVDFTMDDKGVLHSQAPAQAKKARKLGAVTAIAGAASGKPGFAGIGINSTRTEMYSDFSKVKSVKAYPRRNIIKVNSPFNKNQVYASKEDFDFVLNYIRTHTNK